MKVLYATDGRRPTTEAGRLLERIGDRERVETTVVSVNSFDLALRADPELVEIHVLAVAKSPSPVLLPVPGAALEGVSEDMRIDIERDHIARAKAHAEHAAATLVGRRVVS